MAEIRKGRQTPTQSVILPYAETKGDEAIRLYNSSKRTAQEWQELILYDMLAVNKDGLWVHTKFGYSVPRRNGKNEIVVMRELYGLKHGEHIMHTAHRTSTTHSAWERLYERLEKAGITIVSSYRAFGKEHIEVEGGGKVEFRTRTTKGGLGEGFDLLVIDEAQEYQNDHESALKYVVTDSANPQTIFCGTPPTPVSSGTVFMKYRRNVLTGNSYNSGWAEWSVDFMSDPKDKELWYLTNPSLGTVFTERSILDEVGDDETDFNIQRLGLWLQYNQKSAISQGEWDRLQCSMLPEFQKSLYVGIKYGHDGTNVAMSVAVKTTEKKIFVETIDCQSVRNGNKWILEYLKYMRPAKIVIDGAGGQKLLADDLKEFHIKGVVLPTVKEIISANTAFEAGLFSESICHMEQPSVSQVISNCEKRAIGSNGGFGYKPQKEGIEIAIMDSIVLAHWACSKSRERRKQKVSY